MKRIKSVLSVVLTLAIITSMAVLCIPSANAATTFSDENGVVYSIISNFEAHVYGYTGTEPVVTVPEKVGARVITAVDSSAFKSNSVVQEVYLPKTVLSIGDMAFISCSNLTHVDVPVSVNTIGNYAFALCPSLNDININSNIQTISSGMFEQSGITSITFPYNVTSVKASAFEGCTNLKSVTIPDRITSLSDYAFMNCTSLESVKFGTGVKTISLNAFKNCTSLDDVVLSDSVAEINASAFENCSSLRSVTIPKTTTSINSTAFLNCTDLTIFGYKDSYAQQYAEDNNIDFVALDDYKLGDVNLDGIISIDDSSELQKYIAYMIELSDEAVAVADIDKDGNINIDDATLIQKYIAEIITSFD